MQMLYMSRVRTVDSVNISCAYCDCYFCDWIPNCQESQCASINCTFLLEGGASEKQHNNVKQF